MNETSSETARILVVEDDACAALLFKTILQKEGYQVEQCPDGEAALGVLRKQQFDAVVLDLMMPRVDGMQVLKQMRGMPEHMLTPVIVITAARLKIVEDEAARYGARFYLDKTQTDKLVAGIREILKERSGGPPPRLRMASGAPAQERPNAAPPVNPAPSESAEPVEEPRGLGRFFRRKGG